MSTKQITEAVSPEDSQQRFYYPDPVDYRIIQAWLFADLLPWQRTTWHYLTSHYPNIPHAILFAANAGTGKRAFVYRFTAWVLCRNRIQQQALNPEAPACGQCESCQWLMANTHPNLVRLPLDDIDHTEPNNKKVKANTNKPSAKKLIDESPNAATHNSIKIEAIRQIQPFLQQSSEHTRIAIIHQADTMTIAASNAFLKTLEEPANNVLIMLLSDTPSQLLPTIRSRLQSFRVSPINNQDAITFMQQQMPTADKDTLIYTNQLSVNAPFVALDMLTSQWYQHRQTWLNSWQALRIYQRTPIQASDYWQKTLTLSDFLYLSQLMLTDIAAIITGIDTVIPTLDINKLNPLPSLNTIIALQNCIATIYQDRQQNIQDKFCYDKLMTALQSS